MMWIGVVAVLVVVTAISTVAWQAYSGERSGEVRAIGDDPRVFVYQGSAHSLVQLGTPMPVEYDRETRCLFVIDRQGDRVLPVWPRGTRPVVQDGLRGVRIPGIGVVTDGDELTGGDVVFGDFHDPESWEGIGSSLLDLDACVPDAGTFALFAEILGVDTN
jgi:hypothetical protein